MNITDLVTKNIWKQDQNINADKVRNIILLYESHGTYIGDNCVQFDMLRIFKSFFKYADLDINWRDKKHTDVFTAILDHNPYVRTAGNLDWQEIKFEDYDIIFCALVDEYPFIDFIVSKYPGFRNSHTWVPAIFSLSARVGNLMPTTLDRIVFPEYAEFITSSSNYVRIPHIYLQKEERHWGNNWLRENGLKADEQLFIMLDSSSQKLKLLATKVYFEILEYILGKKGVRVLIFDENSLGKEDFYREWLGEKVSKIIFCKSLRLRKSLCIIGSDYTRFIFGPCTGLLHCASGIYNNFTQTGMPAHCVPLMITYTGNYMDDLQYADRWWGTSPLVKCLILRKKNDKKEVVFLNSLIEAEKKDTANLLPCKEYTSSMILNILSKLNI